MLCPSVISRFGTLADKQRFDAASAMGQSRSSGDVASISELPSKAVLERTSAHGSKVPIPVVSRCSTRTRYSITSSARASTVSGSVREPWRS